jgi:hypothetical protein
MPAEESSPAPKEEAKEAEPSKSSSRPAKQPSNQDSPESSQKSASKEKLKGAGTEQKYPLYPSVAVLLHTHNLSASDIPATGPNGRLLKGDVLAFLDQIPQNTPKELASRFTKLSHLDLSNIKVAPPKEKQPEKKAVEAKVEELPVDLAVPVSLAAVLEVQRRMSESLGITLPLSTFLARAIALANEDLPSSRTTPTADELFDAVLGLDKIHAPKTKHGAFEPQIVALPDPSLRLTSPALKKSKKSDLFDELVALPQKVVKRSVPGAAGAIGAENIFSLSVDKTEEVRAKIFLERVKSVLEAEPGRLVL